MCKTMIDMLNPSVGLVIEGHNLDKNDTCGNCGLVLKNYRKFIEQNLLLSVNFNGEHNAKSKD